MRRHLVWLAALWAIAGCNDTGQGPTHTDTAEDGAPLDAGSPDSGCATAADCPEATGVCEVATCTDGVCGKGPAADGTTCDDGVACTANHTCQAGSCTAGDLVCDCLTTADCHAKEDGDLCNGTLFCDSSGASPKCVVNPATVVTCKPGDDVCKPIGCDPKDGECKASPAADGTGCDDGNQCTKSDACDGKGSCVGVADSACACLSDADCAKHEDGDLCNGTLYCDQSTYPFQCVVNPATPVLCPTKPEDACQPYQCDPADGLCHPTALPDGATCDADGFACTPDACDKGQCQQGQLDGSCTCNVDADCAKYDNGDVCDGTLYCNKASKTCAFNPATVVVCPALDDTACRKNLCNPTTGACQKVDTPAKVPCEDGYTCSTNDACDGKGACKPGTNTCQCTDSADCAKYASADKCAAQLYCEKPSGVCKGNPATVKVCESVADTPCSKNQCDPKTGDCKMTPVAEGKACEADNSACTTIDTCQGGACKAASNQCPCKTDADCADKDDGDQCNGTMYCNLASKVCEVNPSSVVSCPKKGTTCLPNVCDPKDGQCKATPAADGTKCETDDFFCTQERCKAGKCAVSVPENTCLCWEDGDCDAISTGNQCIGELFCDKSANAGKQPVCKLNKATAVTCPVGDGKSCDLPACDPKTGKCTTTKKAADGTACDDGDLCTKSDLCLKGACAGTPQPGSNCDDKVACTVDTCDPKSGCVHTPKPELCDDGKPCTLGECDAKAGCSQSDTDSAKCDDGDACTTGDACKGGLCAGAPLVCDDNDVCTADSCDPKSGCKAAPLSSGSCDDGDACTEGDACQAGKCAPGKAKVCDDGDACTTDSCDSKSGCVATAKTGGACDDGSACTKDDACDKGKCVGQGLQCDDNNPCTDDGCSLAKGCTVTNNTKACDDGNPCTESDTCADGVCEGGPAKDCDDGNPCTNDSCQGGSGCKALNNLAKCDDDDACTTGEACSGGACKGGQAVSCDDGNSCTDDSCAKGSGCSNAQNTSACSDGDACTDKDSCSDGACKAGQALACDDGNPCTNDSCDSKTGCVATNNTATCDDGDACTDTDTCDAGKCAGQQKACDDTNPCTDDSCDSKTGCGFANNTKPCDDGQVCTTSDVCASGSCKGTPKTCPQGEACATAGQSAGTCVDHCDSGTKDGDESDVDCGGSCVTGCVTGKACVLGDDCVSGKCVSGKCAANKTHVVSSLADSGPGSLRQAILDANASDTNDVIELKSGTGAVTITLQSALPKITKPVTIDGSKQPGYQGTPLVTIDCANKGAWGIEATGQTTLHAFILANAPGGVSLVGAGAPSVTNLVVDSNASLKGIGIRVISSTGATTIKGCSAKQRVSGIEVINGTDVTIEDNDVSLSGYHQSQAAAIRISKVNADKLSGGLRIVGNTFEGTVSYTHVWLNQLSNVTVRGKDEQGAHVVLEASKGFGTARNIPLEINNSTNVDVQGIDVSRSGALSPQGVGVFVTKSTNVKLKDVTAKNRYSGFRLTDTTDTIVEDVDVTNSGWCTSDMSAIELRSTKASKLPGGVLITGVTFGADSGRCHVFAQNTTGLKIRAVAGGGANVVLERAKGFGVTSKTPLFIDKSTSVDIAGVDVSGPDAAKKQGTGIRLRDTTTATVSSITARYRARGVAMETSTDVTLVNSDLRDSGSSNTSAALDIVGPKASQLSGGLSISGNTFNANSYQVRLHSADGGVAIRGAAGQGGNMVLERSKGFGTSDLSNLRVEYGANIDIAGLDMSATQTGKFLKGGLYVVGTKGVTVTGCAMKERLESLHFNGCTDIIATGNDVSGSGNCFNKASGIRIIAPKADKLVGGLLISGNTSSKTSQCQMRIESASNLKVRATGGNGANVVLDKAKGMGDGSNFPLVITQSTGVDIADIDLSWPGPNSRVGKGLQVTASSDVKAVNVIAKNRGFGLIFGTITDLTIDGGDVRGSGSCANGAFGLRVDGPIANKLPGGVDIKGVVFDAASLCQVAITSASNLDIRGAAGTGVNVVLERAKGFGLSGNIILMLQSVESSNVQGLDVSGTSGKAGFGIEASKTKSLTFKELTITNRAIGLRFLQPVDAPVVTCSTLSGNTTAVYTDGSATLQNVAFSANDKAVDEAGSGSVTATGCWWGHASGSGSAGGSGDTSSGTVNAGSPLGAKPACAP